MVFSVWEGSYLTGEDPLGMNLFHAGIVSSETFLNADERPFIIFDPSARWKRCTILRAALAEPVTNDILFPIHDATACFSVTFSALRLFMSLPQSILTGH